MSPCMAQAGKKQTADSDKTVEVEQGREGWIRSLKQVQKYYNFHF